jgi:hypothetical protein
VLHKVSTEWSDEEHGINGGDVYSTLQCAGCDGIKLRHRSWFSEAPEDTITFFPPAIFRNKPEWLSQLWLELDSDNDFVSTRLDEIYVALQHNLASLAAMGIRSLLERIMIAKVGQDFGTFTKNSAEFEKLGYLSKKQHERLDAILDAGHATIHRAFEPSKADIITLVDLTEHIVETVYLHEGQVEKLKKRVPARKRK